MVDNIAGEEGKGSIGYQSFDGLVHALFQTDGSITFVVAIRPCRC